MCSIERNRLITKTPHRIFEIYGSRTDAIEALTPKNSPPTENSVLASETFKSLSVSNLEHVVRIEFVGTECYDLETLPELREDFLRLSQALALNSKVLIDFHGVQAFCPECIKTIVEFNARLRNKGSRVVLSCISSEVLVTFFPARRL